MRHTTLAALLLGATGVAHVVAHSFPNGVNRDLATFPATVEIDLVFPRNDTYAPTALLPIVFAFQNSALAASLVPGITLSLVDLAQPNVTFTTPHVDLLHANFSSGQEPTYVYGFVGGLNRTNGGNGGVQYALGIDLATGNCTTPTGEGQQYSFIRTDKSVVFTVAPGGQAIDLTASNPQTCKDIFHVAYNLSNTLNYSIPNQVNGLINQAPSSNTCAELSSTQPLVDGNPCAVSVSPAAASSISASIKATDCNASVPFGNCTSAAAAACRLGPGSMGGGLAGSAALLGGIVMVAMMW
jgi:hypothetical protein